MRSATKEERESVDCYIKSISHKTGLMSVANGVDYKVDFKLDDLDFYVKHPKADMSNVYKIKINGKVYLAADKVLEIIDLETSDPSKGEDGDEPMSYSAGWMACGFTIQDKVEALRGEQE